MYISSSLECFFQVPDLLVGGLDGEALNPKP